MYEARFYTERQWQSTGTPMKQSLYATVAGEPVSLQQVSLL